MFVSNAESRLSLEGQSSLRIDGLQEEDAGSYTCRAVNQEDSVDADALITVQGQTFHAWYIYCKQQNFFVLGFVG